MMRRLYIAFLHESLKSWRRNCLGSKGLVPNKDFPDSFEADSFCLKIDLFINYFIDMTAQGFGWIVAAV